MLKYKEEEEGRNCILTSKGFCIRTGCSISYFFHLEVFSMCVCVCVGGGCGCGWVVVFVRERES